MKRRIDGAAGLGGLAFTWLAVLVVSYYVYHKPLTPGLALGLGQAAAQIAAAGALACLAGGAGTWLLRRGWPGLDLPPLVRLALAAALGFGALALGGLAVGASLGFSVWVAWGGLLGLALLLRRSIAAWLHDWSGLLGLLHAAGRFEKWLAGYLALALGLALMVALAPPLKFDALVYHLALPRQYIAAGRLIYVPGNMYWGWPQSAEMLYTWAILLAGNQTAVVLGWMFGLLALVGLLGFASSSGGRLAWVSAALLLSGYSLAAALAWGYIDWLVMLVSVAWLAALSRWPVPGRGLLALAGLLAGMAFGVKYTAGLLAALGGLFVVGRAWRIRRRLAQAVGDLAVYALAAALPALPWLAKNWLATGSPVYPLLFPAGAMSDVRLAAYQSGAPFGGWADLFLLPFRATYLGSESNPGYGASIGPLLFGLAGAGLLLWRRLDEPARRALRLPAWVAGTGVLAWMILGRFSSYLLQARIYYVIFPALALVAAAGWEALQGLRIPGLRLGRLAAALMIVTLAFNALELAATVIHIRPLEFLVGETGPEDYLDHNLGWYAPAMRAVRALPPGSRTLLLWEARPFYCLPACDPDEIVDRWLQARYDYLGAEPHSNAEILANWRRAGYTHVLIQHAGAEFVRQEGRLPYSPADWLAYDNLLTDLPTLQDFGGAYSLHALTP